MSNLLKWVKCRAVKCSGWVLCDFKICQSFAQRDTGAKWTGYSGTTMLKWLVKRVQRGCTAPRGSAWFEFQLGRAFLCMFSPCLSGVLSDFPPRGLCCWTAFQKWVYIFVHRRGLSALYLKADTAVRAFDLIDLTETANVSQLQERGRRLLPSAVYIRKSLIFLNG